MKFTFAERIAPIKNLPIEHAAWTPASRQAVIPYRQSGVRS